MEGYTEYSWRNLQNVGERKKSTKEQTGTMRKVGPMIEQETEIVAKKKKKKNGNLKPETQKPHPPKNEGIHFFTTNKGWFRQ